MAKPVVVLRDNLGEHGAVRAWCQFRGTWIEPGQLEILKLKPKSAVYRLVGVERHGTSVIAKRCSRETARLQRMICEDFLAHVPLPALHCYGLWDEPGGDSCWLFLEEASGMAYEPACAEHRVLAGHWLAEMHLTRVPAELKVRLPDHGLDHHRKLLRSCLTTLEHHLSRNSSLAGGDAALVRRIVGCCNLIEAHWDELRRICEVVPLAVVHGDFAAKNIRVQQRATGPALLVFDWEYAGWGVPATDLAQFVGGVASPNLAAYCSALNRDHLHPDVRAIRRVADCGNLLRLVDEIYWATLKMEFGSYALVAKPVAELLVYENRLLAELPALNWT